jgi:mevalonate kinase
MHSEQSIQVDITRKGLQTIIRNLHGLTRRQAEQIIMEVVADDRRFDEQDINRVMAAKRRALHREGLLEYVEVPVSIDEIGGLTMDGMATLRSGDLERLGRLMTRDHNLLAILGVSTPELQKLVDASLPFSYGAKLTGAGGGGSMVALTDQPEKVAQAIKARGGVPFIVRTGVDGVKIEKD